MYIDYGHSEKKLLLENLQNCNENSKPLVVGVILDVKQYKVTVVISDDIKEEQHSQVKSALAEIILRTKINLPNIAAIRQIIDESNTVSQKKKSIISADGATNSPHHNNIYTIWEYSSGRAKECINLIREFIRHHPYLAWLGIGSVSATCIIVGFLASRSRTLTKHTMTNSR